MHARAETAHSALLICIIIIFCIGQNKFNFLKQWKKNTQPYVKTQKHVDTLTYYSKANKSVC